MGASQTQQKTLLVAAIILTLAVVTESGYVDLYRDAYFKYKLARVKDVVSDVCYTFKCNIPDRSLDNSITSAIWHDLPEKTTSKTIPRREDTTIMFYTELDCKGGRKSWKIKTQSKHNMYFPENFRLDNMDDDISSFRVIQAGESAGSKIVCPSHESFVMTNATTNGENSQGL